MTWHQVSITAEKNNAPIIGDFLSDSGAVSVTFVDAKDEPIYEPKLGETKIWTQTIVIGLFELDCEPKVIKHSLYQQFSKASILNWHEEILADQIWERTWMKHYQPMKFADKLWVCPTGQAQQEAGTVCLTLDPGLAFGTGTHATTALCLEWLASHDLQGKTVIDYGCGSGILAIAAILLGAKMAYAVDIDPQALIATQANAEKNAITDKIQCMLATDFQSVPVDIVLANILAKPLIELQPQITALVKPQGSLILSGILTEQALKVSNTYAPKFTMQAPTIQTDWCRLEGHKLTTQTSM